eukprot:scaffold152593_cov19-Tisochrysis_lutea.AAC.1
MDAYPLMRTCNPTACPPYCNLKGIEVEAVDACIELCTLPSALLTCKGSALKHEWVGRGDDGFPVMEGKGSVLKHEWVGMGDDGFPVLEGKVNNVMGEKLDKKPVDDTLRATIKAYCTGMCLKLIDQSTKDSVLAALPMVHMQSREFVLMAISPAALLQ